MRSDTIVAYTYRAETLCEVCTVDKLRKHLPHYGPFAWKASAEDALDSVAKAYGIDRENESSFDSDIFPKVVFADQIDDDEDHNRCDGCGERFLP